MRRVVVTGLGVVSPLGSVVGKFWENLLNGACGMSKIAIDSDPLYQNIPCLIAGQVDMDEISERSKRFKGLPKFIQFGLLAAEEAVEDSCILKCFSEHSDRLGVSIGSGMSTLDEIYKGYEVLQTKGPRKVSPHFIPRILGNMVAGHVAMQYRAMGPLLSSSTACATGLHAIGDACIAIQRGHADAMIAGASESAINPLSFAGFCQAKALTTAFNDNPCQASRPFDRDRCGFVIGEGAAVLILEEEEHALERGAKIYGRIIGYGLSADAHHITASHPEGYGAFLAMKNTISDASLQPCDIDYINAHATSTPIGDEAEFKALKRLFADRSSNPVLVSSIKGAIGHLLGASGSIEILATMLSLHHQIVPPTINLENCAFDSENLQFVSKAARNTCMRYALSNSFGFGGVNGSICMEKVKN